MSLNRLIFYSAVIGGWAALLGCLLAELLIARPGWFGDGTVKATAFAALVGAVLGAGLNLVAGMANGQLRQQARRLGPGLLIGGVGGAFGGLIANLVFNLGLPRAIGWVVMGLGIGAVEGLYERSPRKIRNGLIGGGVGGLIGGILFDPMTNLVTSNTGMAGRATAFVILGLAVGTLVGLVQVVLKEAWLTVLDGYRPGRQLILSKDVTVLGAAEHVALPFLGSAGKGLSAEQVRVVRQPNGTYRVEEGPGATGTTLNGAPLQGPTVLRDGDLIRLGSNSIRFRERQRDAIPTAAVVPESRPVAAPRLPLPTPSASGPVAVATPSSAPAAPPDPNACPKCGRKVPGPPGRRRCLFDQTVF